MSAVMNAELDKLVFRKTNQHAGRRIETIRLPRTPLRTKHDRTKHQAR